MVDITPLVPAGRQVIQGYGDGGFRIGGEAYRGSVLVFPSTTLSWPVTALHRLTPDSLARVSAAEPAVEILLIGCGREIAPLPAEMRRALQQRGIVAETMDTGAACRTFNVLLSQDRAVAAALIAID